VQPKDLPAFKIIFVTAEKQLFNEVIGERPSIPDYQENNKLHSSRSRLHPRNNHYQQNSPVFRADKGILKHFRSFYVCHVKCLRDHSPRRSNLQCNDN